MAWVVKVHVCFPPVGVSIYDAGPGSVWQCDDCGYLWTLDDLMHWKKGDKGL